MNLDDAIAVMEGEITALGTPREDTREWWLLRARSTGLSMLKMFKLNGVTTVQAEVMRRGVRRSFMKLPEDISEEVTLPPVKVPAPTLASPALATKVPPDEPN